MGFVVVMTLLAGILAVPIYALCLIRTDWSTALWMAPAISYGFLLVVLSALSLPLFVAATIRSTTPRVRRLGYFVADKLPQKAKCQLGLCSRYH